MTTTTESPVHPTLTELADRYAATREAAGEITRTLMRAALDMSRAVDACREIGAAHNELRTDFQETLDSLKIAVDATGRRLEAFDGGGVIAEAITGFDNLFDVVIALQNYVGELLDALGDAVSKRDGDVPTLSGLLAADQ